MYSKILVVVLAVLLGMSVKAMMETKEEFNNFKKSVIAFNQANKRSAEVITEIREKIKYVKEDCNCYNMPIPNVILDRVQGNQ